MGLYGRSFDLGSFFGGFLFLSSLIQHQFEDEERLKLVYIVLVGIMIQSILGIIQYYGLGAENSFILAIASFTIPQHLAHNCYRSIRHVERNSDCERRPRGTEGESSNGGNQGFAPRSIKQDHSEEQDEW